MSFISPAVNDAVALACAALGQDAVHLGRGSRCEASTYRPDWSLVSKSRRESDGRYLNLLPGDTKLHRKWYPGIINHNYSEWLKPVSQIMTYMVHHESRYGFIITDGNLVVFRITVEPIGPGFATRRPRREVRHQRFDSTGTDVSMESLTLSEASSFRDVDPFNREYREPEYAVIPWEASGKCLTVKLALWCLSMMAMGDTSLGEEYPPLDSWARLGRGYVHNTSGSESRRLPKDAILWAPPEVPEGGHIDQDPSWQQQGWQDQGEAYSNQNQGQDEPFMDQDGDIRFTDEGDEGTETPRAGSSVQRNPSPVSESSSTPGKKKVRAVKLTKTGRGQYTFTNSKGKVTQSIKNQWTKVDDGYEYYGEKHVYFTERLP